VVRRPCPGWAGYAAPPAAMPPRPLACAHPSSTAGRSTCRARPGPMPGRPPAARPTAQAPPHLGHFAEDEVGVAGGRFQEWDLLQQPEQALPLVQQCVAHLREHQGGRGAERSGRSPAAHAHCVFGRLGPRPHTHTGRTVHAGGMAMARRLEPGSSPATFSAYCHTATVCAQGGVVWPAHVPPQIHTGSAQPRTLSR
jgi:hypothetical protein